MSRKFIVIGSMSALVLLVLENVWGLTFDAASVVLAGALVAVTVTYVRSTQEMAAASAEQVAELRRQTELSRSLAERQSVASAWAEVWRAQDEIGEVRNAMKRLGRLEGRAPEDAREFARASMDQTGEKVKHQAMALSALAPGLPREVERPIMKFASKLQDAYGASILVVSAVIAATKDKASDEVCRVDEVAMHWMTSCRDEIRESPTWDDIVSGSFVDTIDEAHDVAWRAIYDFLQPDDPDADA